MSLRQLADREMKQLFSIVSLQLVSQQQTAVSLQVFPSCCMTGTFRAQLVVEKRDLFPMFRHALCLSIM